MQLSAAELMAGLDQVRRAPADEGTLRLIVRRPAVGERELVRTGRLDPDHGLLGDGWLERGSRHTADGRADPAKQVTVMNVRLAELVAVDPGRVPLAGDQLYVDLDLSVANLPPGALLSIGTARLRVSEEPHLGCEKFVSRFGPEAMRFVNSRLGRSLRLRGLNARVLVGGVIGVGDAVQVSRSGDRSAAAPAVSVVETG